MNYLKIYDEIIERAKSENRKKKQGIYYERHHIIPKCRGGNNRVANLVLLTAREHYIVHKLLQMAYPEDRNIFFAYHSMITRMTGERKRVSAREYEIAKDKLAFINEMYFLNNPPKKRGKPKPETIEKQKRSIAEYYSELTPEERQNLKGTFKKGDNLGIPRTQEVKDKISKITSSQIIYKGVLYNNFKECSEKLNESVGSIRSRLRREEDKGNPDYKTLKKRVIKNPPPTKAKPILFNGQRFDSLTDAANFIGKTQPRVRQILLQKISENNPDYKFL